MSTNPLLLMSRFPIEIDLLKECLWIDRLQSGKFWHPNPSWVGSMEIDVIEDYFDHGLGRNDPREENPRPLFPRYGTAAEWPFVLRFDYRGSWSRVLAAMIMRLHSRLHEMDPRTRLMLVDSGSIYPVFIDEGATMTINVATRNIEYLPERPGSKPKGNEHEPVHLADERVGTDSDSLNLILAIDGEVPDLHKWLNAWCRKEFDCSDPLPPVLRFGPIEFRYNDPGIQFIDPRWVWTLAAASPRGQALTVFEVLRAMAERSGSLGKNAIITDHRGRVWGRQRTGRNVNHFSPAAIPELDLGFFFGRMGSLEELGFLMAE